MRNTYLKVYEHILGTAAMERFEGSHCHRIVPGYEGGLYEDGNKVFLTKEQHSLIHWLRYKLFGNKEDKRAWKLIGVGPKGLSSQDRKDHGRYCYDKQIGMFAPAKLEKSRAKGYNKQKLIYEETGDKQNFYYWSTEEGRKERASLGGKQAHKNGNAYTFKEWPDEKIKAVATKAGNASGKLPVTNGIITKKLKTDNERNEFLENNPEWRKGNHWNNKTLSADKK